MKKQSLLLITGGILAFASCNTDTAGTVDNSQAKVDSMVNERVEMIRAELEAKNDSIINDRAMYLADSMMAVATGKPAPVRKPVAKKPTEQPTTPAKEEPKKSRLEEAADQNQKSASDRLKEKSDQNKQSAADRLKSKSDQNK